MESEARASALNRWPLELKVGGAPTNSRRTDGKDSEQPADQPHRKQPLGSMRPEATTDAAAAEDGTKPKRVRKYTNLVRKEEKEKQLELLEAQAKALRQQQIADPRENFPITHKSLTNENPRKVPSNYRYSLAGVQSAVVGMVERGKLLQELKDHKIRDSARYIQQRSRFLDPLAAVSKNSHFTAANGDYCVLRFDSTPFEGVHSAKQVFEAIELYLYRMEEISISEVLGDITVRDDDGKRDQGVSHHRLISQLECGVQIEVNCVRFAAFFKDGEKFGNGRDFGVIAFDFVDSDELFPYVPKERVREDVTGVLTVKCETRRTMDEESGDEIDELVVVLSRMCLLKLHRPQFEIPESMIEDPQANLGNWGDVMLKESQRAPSFEHSNYDNNRCSTILSVIDNTRTNFNRLCTIQ